MTPLLHQRLDVSFPLPHQSVICPV